MRAETSIGAAGAMDAERVGQSFDNAMKSVRGESSMESASMGQIVGALTDITEQLKGLVGQLAQLIQSMSGNASGASIIGSDNRIRPVEGGTGALGGTQGPSERIPDPTENIRTIQLGSRSMTIGSDGSASAAEVDAAAREMQRMYDVSPSFRRSIDSAGADDLVVTLGRRGDNTSWGGGGRVFLNLNNIEAGNNDRFQGIVGHEFGHAANGLPHGAELESLEQRVQAEA